MKPIRILLCGEFQQFGQAMQTYLRSAQSLELLAQVRTIREALDLCRELHPDVLLLDEEVSNSEAAEILTILREKYSWTQTLVLGRDISVERQMKYLALGVMGFFQPKESYARLEWDIYAVRFGYFCLESNVVKKMALISRSSAQAVPVKALTSQQLKVLQLIYQGWSYPEIAGELGITIPTVRFHLKNCMANLKVRNKYQAIIFAVKMGWI